MALRLWKEGKHLTIQDLRLDWVHQYRYLGVWIDERLTFQKELAYLKERLKARTTVMRAMTGKALGATHRVLRTFYVHAVRSLVDYAAPALITVATAKLEDLEPCQNAAARIILGAQPWTKIVNLEMEASLPSLTSRVRRLEVDFLAKIVQSPRITELSQSLVIALGRVGTHIHSDTWLSQAAGLLDSFRLTSALLEKGRDSPHPEFKPPPPWLSIPATFVVAKLPSKKKLCDQERVRAQALQGIRALSEPGMAVYYTDGSVDPNRPRSAGAAFVTDGLTFGRRVSDHASTLQAEAIAVQLALLLKLHQQGRSVTLNWVPRHVGVPGNELADAAAEAARQRSEVDVVVPLNRNQLRLRTRALNQVQRFLQHRLEAEVSERARWYRAVTDYEPLVLPRSTSREVETLLFRLRLEDRCFWQIKSNPTPEERRCRHCSHPEATLKHYLKHCPATAFLRRGPPTTSEGLVRRLCRHLSDYELRRLVECQPPL
ncbi:uncharacterized protein LOC143038149 [Oratosquilla oratoria]|uniref:uncharacterized protein LOC143038149 n=1 Tax=Oratosquilla oratoria TaxID=337810 RepID=UPI003F76097F